MLCEQYGLLSLRNLYQAEDNADNTIELFRTSVNNCTFSAILFDRLGNTSHMVVISLEYLENVESEAASR
jgi:hypothetical protein